MYWLYLLASIAAFIAALSSSLPTWAVGLLIIASLVFLLMWAFGLLSTRISGRSRNEIHIISPDELRRIREQAQQRKAQSGSTVSSNPDQLS